MEKRVEESAGVAVAKRLLASKHQTQQDALYEFKTNPDIQRAFEQLKQRNEQRGAPIITPV
ncbi:hypothetical protein [Fibrella forsythiae]|uniref:Uncharacterized protein n=1 Tax=Fibrella forsythiae TaxID=2817061 RepID=A0ABS3JLA6_9BACT|nr:hypothetical protein [Fibrella forsythiae]MBO0950009.1 hypothetical protein [Fibrella forsythiae]